MFRFQASCLPNAWGRGCVLPESECLRLRSAGACVTVNADSNFDGQDDLDQGDLNSIADDFSSAIVALDRSDVSGNGKLVEGDVSLRDKAMISVVSQVVGATLTGVDADAWGKINSIQAMYGETSLGGPETMLEHGTGIWTMQLGDWHPGGDFFAGEWSWRRDVFDSPSNLARQMLHGLQHVKTGRGGALSIERALEARARSTLMRNGLGGRGCWNALPRYPSC